MAVIIISEDDAVLRFDLVDLLQSVGFQVIEASSGDEALAILQARDDICGVFTNIQMPGSLDRLQLAADDQRTLAREIYRDWFRQRPPQEAAQVRRVSVEAL